MSRTGGVSRGGTGGVEGSPQTPKPKPPLLSVAGTAIKVHVSATEILDEIPELPKTVLGPERVDTDYAGSDTASMTASGVLESGPGTVTKSSVSERIEHLLTLLAMMLVALIRICTLKNPT